jgi:hypothetical protein
MAMSLTDYLDVLRTATAAELVLREQAEIEFANGNKQGSMFNAHNSAVANVISIAKQLIEFQTNGQSTQ